MGKEDPIHHPQLPDSASTFKSNPEDISSGAMDNNQKYISGNPLERNNYQTYDDQDNNPELKKFSNQEINQEIDLKKNRNRLISTVLVGCAVVPMVVLGLMAFGVISVSSLVLFPGYGASEVVLGLIGVSAVSQISLALVSRSGISKVKEKKLRVYDGINPSVEQDIYYSQSEQRNSEKNQDWQGPDVSDKWQKNLSLRGKEGSGQRNI